MANSTATTPPSHTMAAKIDGKMREIGLTNHVMARRLGTKPSVIAAIRSGDLPMPLAWIPTAALLLHQDQAGLMNLALDEQWYDTLIAIAGALVWRRQEVEQDWLDLIVSFCDGVMPDPQDVPKIVTALREAIKDSSSTH